MAARKTSSPAAKAIVHLRELGLARFPGAHLKSPWPGHSDLAVDDKTFAYLSGPGDPPGMSVKLPLSGPLALALQGARPAAYGLGRAGWVSLSFDGHALPPMAQLEAWLEESYRAQASKRRLAEFEGGAVVAVVRKQARKKAAKK